MHLLKQVQAFKTDQLCIIDDGCLRTRTRILLPPLGVFGNLQWHWDHWEQPPMPKLQSSIHWHSVPRSGPTLVDSSWNQHWFRWAWAQVTSSYKQSIFITVEVYSDLVKYLQNYAALSLLAVCSCQLIPSVKSGSLSSPHLFSTPASLKTPLNFFAPFLKTDGEIL